MHVLEISIERILHVKRVFKWIMSAIKISKIKRSFQDVKRDFELACQFHNLLEQRVSPETHSTLGRVSL